MRFVLKLIIFSLLVSSNLLAKPTAQSVDHVALIPMDMMILTGTGSHLESSLDQAAANGAKIAIVELNTPGGLLDTTQEMVQKIFSSKIPVIIYVSPTGASATSAGVFITMAGHIAAMAPGTSIGAAHPVMGDGKDIEGDMRKKAENSTIALAKSISEKRKRNIEWSEKAVKESVSITATEALDLKVVDVVSASYAELLKEIAGKKVELEDEQLTLGDYSNLPIKTYEISSRDKVINFFANPNIAALLWLGATTGLSIELYNPGAIFPGVVGVICLLLALTVMQVLPISQIGLIMLLVGGAMLGLELMVGGGILAIGGLVCLTIGLLYFVDVTQAPGLAVDPEMFLPFALAVMLFMFWVLREMNKKVSSKYQTADSSLVGSTFKVDQLFLDKDKCKIFGEIWKVRLENPSENVSLGDELEVISVKNLTLLVKPVSKN